jgi:hypothetical protein
VCLTVCMDISNIANCLKEPVFTVYDILIDSECKYSGFIHNSDITWGQRTPPPPKYFFCLGIIFWDTVLKT